MINLSFGIEMLGLADRHSVASWLKPSCAGGDRKQSRSFSPRCWLACLSFGTRQRNFRQHRLFVSFHRLMKPTTVSNHGYSVSKSLLEVIFSAFVQANRSNCLATNRMTRRTKHDGGLITPGHATRISRTCREYTDHIRRASERQLYYVEARPL